jgi:hypothetical protein
MHFVVNQGGQRPAGHERQKTQIPAETAEIWAGISALFGLVTCVTVDAMAGKTSFADSDRKTNFSLPQHINMPISTLMSDISAGNILITCESKAS